jgi:SnoaL-like domain
VLRDDGDRPGIAPRGESPHRQWELPRDTSYANNSIEHTQTARNEIMAALTGAHALSEEFLRDFANRWSMAWNSHNTEQVLELLDADVVWEDTVFWPRVIEGRGGVGEYTDTIWKVMPDVQFEEVQFFSAAAQGRGLFLFRQSGSAPARFATDRRFATYGCDIFLGFRDGKLSRYLAQYEITEMMRQYGALPPRGDLLGGSYLMSLMNHTASSGVDPAQAK